MGAFSISSKSLIPLSYKHQRCYLKGKQSVVVHCQSSRNVVKSGALSSGLRERSKLASDDNGKGTPMDNGGAAKSLVEMEDGIGIVKYLRGKDFLITGATGFLAKVLIEKILRTVPDVGKVFLLIKAKSKEAAMQRLKTEIINTELFKCLQQTYGTSYEAFMLSKLVPVFGNLCESNLGLEETALDGIAKDVDIIVNAAANTTFDERYDVALDINTVGPSRLMNFAKKCEKLKLFLHISTAYVNGLRQGRIMEKPLCIGDSIVREHLIFETGKRPLPFLSFEVELKLVLESRASLDDNTVAQKMKDLGFERAKIHGWHDTYAFTKAMGEMLVDSMRGEIPVVIVRPSAIESTYSEPFPGWIEGNRMMDPIALSYGKGLLNGFLADPNGVLDVVPADMVVNATLAATAKHGSAGKPESNVYQTTSSVVNPLVFQDLFSVYFHQHFEAAPWMDPKGRPVLVHPMKLFGSMEDFKSHLWSDAIERTGLKFKQMENICRMASVYQPYTFYGGRFDNSNTRRLMEFMSEEEREEFGFDVGSIDWKDYIANVHIPGLRKHVMKGRGM